MNNSVMREKAGVGSQGVTRRGYLQQTVTSSKMTTIRVRIHASKSGVMQSLTSLRCDRRCCRAFLSVAEVLTRGCRGRGASVEVRDWRCNRDSSPSVHLRQHHSSLCADDDVMCDGVSALVEWCITCIIIMIMMMKLLLKKKKKQCGGTAIR